MGIEVNEISAKVLELLEEKGDLDSGRISIHKDNKTLKFMHHQDD